MSNIGFDIVCTGYRIENSNTRKFYYIVRNGGAEHECLVYADNGQIISAYKNVVGTTGIDEYCYVDKTAANIYKDIVAIGKGFGKKNGTPTMHVIGACSAHQYTKKDKKAYGTKYMGELVEIDFHSDNLILVVTYFDRVDSLLAKGQDFRSFGLEQLYIKLEKQKASKSSEDDDIETVTDSDIAVRQLEEIALEKDITWLHKKKYYVVNDEAKAEQIFQALEKYNGVISYDVETSGLHINMFGQIGSPRVEELKKWNEENPKEAIKADYLVGFSFTVEENTGFYFPCAHRKFKNIYESREEGSPGLKLANLIKSLYTIGQYRDRDDYMAQYIRKTPAAEITCDVLLMERCRYIFEKKDILAFNGIFEWKTTWLYSIDLNLKEDPMILHQLLYKFKRERVRTGGEPSNLKYLTKVECGVEQLDLSDFFVGYKEDESNVLRSGSASGKSKSKSKNKKKLNIDFSYMDLRGTQAYAPADVDFALIIWKKYKLDLINNYPEMEYIYNVEVVMAMAVAYAEFYGLRINEDKIEAVRKKNLVDICLYEHEFRKLVGLAGNDEIALVAQLKDHLGANEDTADDTDEELVNTINNLIKEKGDLNMGAPGQVGDLLYGKYNWPLTEDGKKSMGKKVIKQYEKAVDENGNLLYPEVKWYRKYKDAMTLDSKFFGKLREFTMPGGFMFANFGSISCSTGRMSCRTPNLQQMPKSISKIIEPREGFVFCDADFAQIELRVLVALAHETGLIEYFKDPDADMHSMLASMLFDLPFAKVDIPDETGKSPRQQCKGLNFGIPYGMGIASLAITLYGVATAITKAWAKDKYDKYAEKMPNVWDFFANVKEHAQVTEFSSTYFGRRRYYKFTDADGNYSSKHVAMALRQAGNAVIQGCLDGNTRIQTKEYGFVKIKDVVGKRLNVWDGEGWTLGDISDSGLKQKCIVTFSTGQKFICSPIHKFLVKSTRGKTRFVECKDLVSKEHGTNAHRVVINTKYVESDSQFLTIEPERTSHNANNACIQDIETSFKAGVVLGRLASDGSVFNRDIGGSSIRQLVADHEIEVLDVLKEYMEPLGCSVKHSVVREGRNEAINWVEVYSDRLTSEIDSLKIKEHISDRIFADTEMLRGFLKGLFDGDGGICGESIVLTFGGSAARAQIVDDVQKALMLFGIKSSIVRTQYMGNDIAKVNIRKHDNQRFAELIGFINNDKQEKAEACCVKYDGHIFGSELIVEKVEITDEYIQMYDVCNTAGGYYMADGIITHNTAADIFKIAMARIFTFVRTHNLIGKVLMSNFIHDEGLYEIDVKNTNVNEILANIIHCQQVQIKGFPPLTVGAGIGKNWASAKGGMAEIHPLLGNQIMEQAGSVDAGHTPEEVYKYYEKLNENFRKSRIAKYIKAEQEKFDNGQDIGEINPVMAKLMTLAFDNGVEAQLQEEAKQAGLTGDKLTAYLGSLDARRLIKFIELNPELFTDVNPTWVSYADRTAIKAVDDEEDVAYEDDEDEDSEISEYEFALIDESNSVFGLSLQDIIDMFGLIVSKERGICGIDSRRYTSKQLDKLADLINEHVCDKDDEGAMEFIIMRQNRLIKKTGIYVKDIAGSEIEQLAERGTA